RHAPRAVEGTDEVASALAALCAPYRLSVLCGRASETARGRDLFPLFLERGGPVAHAAAALTLQSRLFSEARGQEEILNLGVGELAEQIREEPAAGFRDDRIVQRAALRWRQVRDTVGLVLPDGRTRPLAKIRAAPVRVVRQRCGAEGEA